MINLVISLLILFSAPSIAAVPLPTPMKEQDAILEKFPRKLLSLTTEKGKEYVWDNSKYREHYTQYITIRKLDGKWRLELTFPNFPESGAYDAPETFTVDRIEKSESSITLVLFPPQDEKVKFTEDLKRKGYFKVESQKFCNSQIYCTYVIESVAKRLLK